MKKIPLQNFEQKFAEAESDVREYYDFGAHLAELVRSALQHRRSLELEGKRKPSQLKRMPRIIAREALRHEISISGAQQAKLVGNTISSAVLDDIFERCREAEYLPTRWLLNVFAGVPLPYRDEFLRQLLEHGWNQQQTKKQMLRHVGRRGRGGRPIKTPQSLEECREFLVKHGAKIDATLGVLNATGTTRRRGNNTLIPPAVLRNVNACRDLLRALTRQVAELASEQAVPS